LQNSNFSLNIKQSWTTKQWNVSVTDTPNC